MGGKTVLAIDPGPVQSAWVALDDGHPERFAIDDNQTIADTLEHECIPNLAIEMIASYGMPVGAEIFDTCVWIGRFIQAWNPKFDEAAKYYVYRKDVKMHLCGSMKAKDSNIRQALIDKFGPGRQKAIGTKNAPGPLYGVKKDIWAALAVAVTWAETREDCNEDDDRKGD